MDSCFFFSTQQVLKFFSHGISPYTELSLPPLYPLMKKPSAFLKAEMSEILSGQKAERELLVTDEKKEPSFKSQLLSRGPSKRKKSSRRSLKKRESAWASFSSNPDSITRKKNTVELKKK